MEIYEKSLRRLLLITIVIEGCLLLVRLFTMAKLSLIFSLSIL